MKKKLLWAVLPLGVLSAVSIISLSFGSSVQINDNRIPLISESSVDAAFDTVKYEIALQAGETIEADSVSLNDAAGSSNDYTYTLNDNGNATITKYNGTDTSVEIPQYIDGHEIRTIGKSAFASNANITSVSFPSSSRRATSTVGFTAFAAAIISARISFSCSVMYSPYLLPHSFCFFKR